MSKIKLRVDPHTRAEHVAIRLQEATASSDWQMILPMGTFITRSYGKLNFTKEYLDELVANWRAKVLGERQPFVDSDHDWGKANGWITDLAVQKDGLYAKIDWTELGKANIEGKLYKYFSADIGDAVDVTTGDVVSPVLIGAALTNTPQMNMMPPAHLSERLGGPGSGRYPAGSGGNKKSASAAAKGGSKGTRGKIEDDETMGVSKTNSNRNGSVVTGSAVLDFPDAEDSDFDARLTTDEQAADLFERQIAYNGQNAFDTPAIDRSEDIKSVKVKATAIDRSHLRIDYKVVLTPEGRDRADETKENLSESSARGRRRARSDARSSLSEEGNMNKKLKELWAKLDDKELSEEDRGKVMAEIKQLSLKLSDELEPEPEEKDESEEKDETEAEAEDEDEDETEAEPGEKDASIQASVRRLRRDVKTVMDVNKTLATQLKELRAERSKEREDGVISRALSEGKFLPKEEKTWRRRFHESPKLTSDILKEMPEGTAIDFSERGVSGGGAESEVQLTADDLTAARVARMAPEEYKKLKLSGKGKL